MTPEELSILQEIKDFLLVSVAKHEVICRGGNHVVFQFPTDEVKLMAKAIDAITLAHEEREEA